MTAVNYKCGLFPPESLDWARLIPLIGPASAAIARYDGVLEAIPNAMILLSPLTTREAVLSSRIEGTQATMGEVLEYEAGADTGLSPDSSKAADIQEVINYRRAILSAVSRLDVLPLSQRLIKETHIQLLSGVRGQNRAPGEYRKIQNWIGPPGMPVEKARYVPIAANHINESMSAWERYLHGNQPDQLVQMAVLHAEFEAIHPFLDGNGRLGRMLIPLFLYEKKLLLSPTFYISAYFESRRDEYYERLLAISRDGDWTGWCIFFLQALLDQGIANTKKAQAILSLYRKNRIWIMEKTRSQHAINALDFIFNRPIFNTSDFNKQSNIPEATAKRIIKILRDDGLVQTLRESSGRRPAILVFAELINLIEDRTVF